MARPLQIKINLRLQVYKGLVRTAQRKGRACITATIRGMPCKEIMAVHCEKHTCHINAEIMQDLVLNLAMHVLHEALYRVKCFLEVFFFRL